MRVFASILFLLMTLILPTAGVTRSFCTISMAFVSENGECPFEMDNCCCEEGQQDVPRPDCVIAAKSLPNADKTPMPDIPDADDAWILLPVTHPNFASVVKVDVAPFIYPYGLLVNPDPLYLTQRRLLL